MSTFVSSRRVMLAGLGTVLVSRNVSAFAQMDSSRENAVAKHIVEDNMLGFDAGRLARIGPAIQTLIDKGAFPGAVTMIARRGDIVHFETHGFQDAAKTKPMARDAIFLQASMTKPLVSALAMQFVEEGRIKLGDPIALYLPELRDLKLEVSRNGQTEIVSPKRQPTVHDLLRHTAGFVYGAFVYGDGTPSATVRQAYLSNNIEMREGPITGDEMLQRLGKIPLAFEPGTHFLYSIGVDVLGLLLQRVSGQRLDHVLNERLIRPLGLKDTAWFVPPEKRSRLAEAFNTDPLREPMWRRYDILADNADKAYLRGGIGLVSTVPDYFRFAQMIANGGQLEGQRYLATPTVNLMLANHTAGMGGQGQGGSLEVGTGPGYGFGLGFAVRTQEGMGSTPGSYGDAMWPGAWGTAFTIDRAEALVAIIMTQGPSSSRDLPFLWKDLVYGAMVESIRR